jgi:hypothetical protein
MLPTVSTACWYRLLALAQVRDIAYSLKPERKSSSLVAALSKIGNLKVGGSWQETGPCQRSVNHAKDLCEDRTVHAEL